MRKIRDFIYDWLDREESFIFWMVAMFAVSTGISWGLACLIRGNSWGLLHEFFIISCNIAISFFTVTVIDIILYCVFTKFRLLHKTIKIFLLAVNTVIFLTDIFTMYFFSSMFSLNMFEFLTRTNVRESSEFLQAYLSDPGLWKFGAVVIISMVIFRVVWVKILNSRPRLRFAVFSICFILSFLASGRQFYLMTYMRAMRFIDSVGATRLANLFYTTRINLKAYEKSSSYTQKAVTLTKNESKIPYVVFILGESTTRNHMSLYGYNMSTNPLLSLRQLRGGG